MAALTDDTRVQNELRKSVWYPRTQSKLVLLPQFLFAGKDLAIALSLVPVLRIYCSTSYFSLTSAVLVNVAYICGKGYCLMLARRKGSTCLQPLSYATPEMLRAVRGQGSIQFFTSAGQSVWIGAFFSLLLGGTACFLVGGWDEAVMPRWAWAISASLVVNLFVQSTLPYGHVVNVTDLFLRSAAAAVVCLQQLTVFHYEQASGSREQAANAGATPFIVEMASPLSSPVLADPPFVCGQPWIGRWRP